MCNRSRARLLVIPSVGFKSKGFPSAPASLLGPRIAQNEMTHPDILKSARLNPHQQRSSHITRLLYYIPFHLLLSPPFVSLNCLQSFCFIVVFEELSGKYKYFLLYITPDFLSLSFFSVERIRRAEFVQQSQLWHEQYEW